MDHSNIAPELPEPAPAEAGRHRWNHKKSRSSALWGAAYALVVIVALTVLAATLWLPFLRIYGTSMDPTLLDGDIVCCVAVSHFKAGDIVAFQYENKLLVKRVIGLPGDRVSLDESGNIYINGILLDEPYIEEKAFGDCDLELPFLTPEGTLFVVGDHRSASVDSRHGVVGCVGQEQILGKIILRVWPLGRLAIFD